MNNRRALTYSFRIGVVLLFISALQIIIGEDTKDVTLGYTEKSLIKDGLSGSCADFLLALPFLISQLIIVALLFIKPCHWLLFLIFYNIVFCFSLCYLFLGPDFMLAELEWQSVSYHFMAFLFVFAVAAYSYVQEKMEASSTSNSGRRV